MKSEEAAIRSLRFKLPDYWSTLEPVPDSMASAAAPASYWFIQQEIVPRRNALYDALQQVSEEDQAALQKSELQFADSRLDAETQAWAFWACARGRPEWGARSLRFLTRQGDPDLFADSASGVGRLE